MKYVVNNKEFDSDNNINQKIKEKFVNRHIITCQTYLINALKDKIDNKLQNEIDLIDERIEELEQEQEEPQEPLEWWEIDNWFADKLRQYKEPILENDYSIYWGRTTSGQSIYMDSVIDEITIDMEILEGQTNSWHKEPEKPVVPDNIGYKCIDYTQRPHPDDSHLYIVLMYNENKKQYVTWYYNKQNNSFEQGHYIENKVDAFKDYAERIA